MQNPILTKLEQDLADQAAARAKRIRKLAALHSKQREIEVQERQGRAAQ